MGQDAAFEEGVELILEELRQVGASSVFGLADERCGVLLQEAGSRGLFRAGGARGGPRRRSEPAAAAGRWLAREAPKVVSLHRRKP